MTARVQEVTAKHPDMILLDSRPCSPRLLLMMLLVSSATAAPRLAALHEDTTTANERRLAEAPPMPPGYLQIAGSYYIITSGSCGGALISTTRECSAAATALDLSDKTATRNYGTSSTYPPGCHFQGANYLVVYNSDSSGVCSSSYKCICMFAPPSPPMPPPLPPAPPSPPPSPPMPPGYLQIAGSYYIITSGSCGGALISTTR
eukprot:scaffold107363_cov65-Phaeocystis_antarctica.AAC.1